MESGTKRLLQDFRQPGLSSRLLVQSHQLASANQTFATYGPTLYNSCNVASIYTTRTTHQTRTTYETPCSNVVPNSVYTHCTTLYNVHNHVAQHRNHC